MGFRFRRSLRIAPGLRLNFSKSGISTSIGGRGATYNIGPRGTRTTVGLPGTGLFWTSTSGRGATGAEDPSGGPGSPSSSAGAAGCGWAMAITAAIAMIAMCSSKTTVPSPTSPSATPEAEAFYVNVRSANCRSAPAPAASVLSGLRLGDSVSVIERSGNWSHVTGAERDCWISSDLLSSTAPDLSLPEMPDRAAAVGLVSSAASAGRSLPRHSRRAHSSFDEGCPCSGSRVCIGPRGGRYCITSGGNKRYGV